MCVNWLDDTISAIISTILAIGVSWWFYHKSNRDAAKNDIMNPIVEAGDINNIIMAIGQAKKMYSYRYLTLKEKAHIQELEKTARLAKQHTYDWAFSESILNYFYEHCNIDRFHPRYISEIEEYLEEPNYYEDGLNLKQYSNNFTIEGEFDVDSQTEIESQLRVFYETEIDGNKKMSPLFDDMAIEKIFYESKEYSQYRGYEQQVTEMIEAIKKWLL